MSLTALREDKYFFAGQAIAVSLVHGGPAPGFFSSSLYASLTGRSAKPEMEEISDSDLYSKIKKVVILNLASSSRIKSVLLLGACT